MRLANLELTIVVVGISLREAYEGQMLTAYPACFPLVTREWADGTLVVLRNTVVAKVCESAEQTAERTWPMQAARFKGWLAVATQCQSDMVVKRLLLDGRECPVVQRTDMGQVSPTMAELGEELMPTHPLVTCTTVVNRTHLALLDRLLVVTPRPRRRRLAQLKWYSLACDQAAPFARLIAQWICFNLQYRDVKKKDRQAFKDYLRKRLPRRAARWIQADRAGQLRELSQAILVLQGAKKSTTLVSAQLSGLLAGPRANAREVISSGVDCVYSVRNDLFHGNRTFDEPADWALLQHADRLMSLVNGYLLCEAAGVCEQLPGLEQQVPPLRR